MDNKSPKRKKNRLECYDYSSCGTYFLTICTLERRNYFWSEDNKNVYNPEDVKLSACGKIAEEAINNIPAIYPAMRVDKYVIMPDHIHLMLMVCADEDGRPMTAPTMSRVVNQLKGYVTRRIGHTIWQKSFFDHVIRNQKDYEEHINYIYQNPT